MKRILHIVGGMNRGGIETWLMHVLRHIDRNCYQMDFLVHTLEPSSYDTEVQALGSQIIPCMHPSKPLIYTKRLHRILRTGRYDVVHSHVHHFSGWVLKIAAQVGIPMRIAHSHNDTSILQAHAALHRHIYFRGMKYLIQRFATHKLSASQLAAAALFGQDWKTDPRHQLLFYGIDLSPFRDEVDGHALRASLGIADNAFVIGHVGRFVEQKNHTFLVQVAAEVCRRESKACFLLVGDGPLRSKIIQQVAQAGLNRHVIFAGLRDDVPALMKGVMNAFLFPSHHEGLGIVLIEAQAAGLPCIYSDVVPQEASIVPPLVQTLSLNQSIELWADAVLTSQSKKGPILQPKALDCVQQSDFGIERSVSKLMAVYEN